MLLSVGRSEIVSFLETISSFNFPANAEVFFCTSSLDKLLMKALKREETTFCFKTTLYCFDLH